MPQYRYKDAQGNVHVFEGPRGLSQQDVDLFASQYFAPAPTPVQQVAPAEPTSGAFVSGFKSYLPQLEETYGGLKALLGVGAERTLGKGAISEALIQSGAESMRAAGERQQALLTPARASFSDALKQGIGSVLTEWLPYQAGSGAAQLLEALGLSAAGGAIGSAMAPGVGTATGVVAGLVEKELVKKGVKEAAEKLLQEYGEDAATAFFTQEAKKATLDVSKKLGQNVAIGAQAGFYGTGQVGQRAFQAAEDRGESLSDVELARVLPDAALSTVAEFISDKIGLGAFKGLDKPTQNYLLNVAKNIFVTGVKESPTELIQSVAERHGAKLSLTDATAIKEYIDATAASFGMAVAPGAAGGVRATIQAREHAKQMEATPPPPAVPPVETLPPTQTQLKDIVESVTGVAAVPTGITPMTAGEAAAQRAEAEPARIGRLQEMIEADMAAQEERARREGPPPEVPRAPTPERTVAPLAEREMPEPTPEAELRAKQLEVDRRRLEAGLPTGESSLLPGLQRRPPLQPEPEPITPTLVDERPMTQRAAKNRLLVLQNLYKNAGRDPESIAIVPHPSVPERFAIQSLDLPVKLQPGLPQTAIEREPTPKVLDPVEAYVNIQRRTNTDAARRFVQDWEAGRITRADVEQALEQEQKANLPPALTYTAEGEREIIPADQYKPRGERFVPPIEEPPVKPPVQEEPPTEEPPGQEPPPPTVEPPKTVEELRQRLPVSSDNAKVRAANNNASFSDLANTLAASSNPVTARVGQLAQKIANEVKLLKPKNLGRNIAGVYNRLTDTVQMAPSYSGDEWTNTHEVVHALVARSQVNPTPRQRPIVRQLDELYNYVYKETKRRGINPKIHYGLTNSREFASEAMSNSEFQFYLMSIPYKGKRSVWTEFTRLVANLLGIKDTNALSEAINLVDRLAQTKRAPFSSSMFGEVDFTEAPTPEPEVKTEKLPAGATPMDIVKFMGVAQQKQTESQVDRTKRLWKEFKEDPELSKNSIKQALTKFRDKMENNVFSVDSAFNNKVRQEIGRDLEQNKEAIGALIEMSQSQTVHSDALGGVFIQMGGIRYDDDTKKWVGFKEDNNFINLSNEVDKVAKKYNLTKDEAMRVAHANFIARRLRSLQDRNAELETKIAALNPQRDAQEIKKLKDSLTYIHLSDEQIQAGLDLGDRIPELKKIFSTWNGIRNNAVKVMVQSGLWSEELANSMLDVIDYVPFYREEQLEAGEGPSEFVRGLQVKAKEHRLKGSDNPVNDVFDNMVRWTQYAINRSIRNHKSLQMIDQAVDIETIDGKMAEKVEGLKKGESVIRVWRDGKQEFYRFADPLFADAFLPIQNLGIPSVKVFSWFANLLRKSVVLYPLFSVAQVPQDAFAAIFTSGLQPKFAFRIPFLAVKEFVQTYRKTSAIHNELAKYGAVGVRDFTSTVIREDAEIIAGLRSEEGWVKSAISKLSHLSMSADNAVRQAVYDAAMQQGVSKAEAIEKAFEIINFRRRPKSMLLNLAGQTIPFFYAYLAAQRAAYNTLSGVGISPQERMAGLKTLAYTSSAVMAMAMLYAMMNEADEEYRNTPTALRDRTITVPGTGGFRIPLRPDFFLFPKIMGEHLYHQMVENGLTDSAKFRTAMKDATVNAIASPTPFPQAVKPILEASINYNFFQGRPLVGEFEKKKEIERQFNNTTSEFAKLIGQTGLVSPIVADHLIRGMFGSVGGAFLWFTNNAISVYGPEVERPEPTFREALAALPGTSGLMSRPTESALKNDFYALRDEVEKATNTYNDYKKFSPEGVQEFISNEKNFARLQLAKNVNQISEQLSKIRVAIRQITLMPNTMMSASEKAQRIKELQDIEKMYLKSANIPKLREMAQL